MDLNKTKNVKLIQNILTDNQGSTVLNLGRIKEIKNHFSKIFTICLFKLISFRNFSKLINTFPK